MPSSKRAKVLRALHLLPLLLVLLLSSTAALAQTGALQVTADAPGTVRVNRTEVGSAPVEVRELAPGRYPVRIAFVGGGATRLWVDVAAGQTSQLHFPYPRKFALGAYRRGIHFMLGANSFYLHELTTDGHGGGGHLEFGFNLGLGTRADLRSMVLVGGGRYGLMHGHREHALEVALRPSIHLNHSETVGTDVGLRLALIETWYRQAWCEGGNSCTQRDLVHVANLGFGLDVAPITLRFGARGEYEVAPRGAILYVPFDNLTVYTQVGVTLSYLLLGG